MVSKSKSGLGGLLSAAKRSESASKSSTPTVNVTPDLAPAIDQLLEAKRAEETAQALRKQAEGQLKDFAQQERVNASRREGKLHASIKLAKRDGSQVTASVLYIQQGRFCQMKVDECIDPLVAEFGDDYPNYFTVAPQLKIDDNISEEQAEALTSLLSGSVFDEIVQMIDNRGKKTTAQVLADIRALCERNAQRDMTNLLTANPVVRPNEKFINDMVFDDMVAARAKKLQALGLCQMIAPSFRVY